MTFQGVELMIPALAECWSDNNAREGDGVDFANSTSLDSRRLQDAMLRHTAPYRHDALTVRVRYSRGAPFSGACYYATSRILVNLGRRNRYPMAIATHVARARSGPGYWSRENLRLTLADAYQLVLFVYMHELYHYLVKQAGRSPRRKEAMCDRFATRVLVDHYGGALLDASGRPAARALWDFQDLDGFVASAPREAELRQASRRPIPVKVLG